ncbi:phage tail tube protein [Variovorax sp. VNK109]|uniref:phage tail tube protein n=1 Tax=Variovorax sp. VNK109 TaxID=3400919 RepID=UPI003BFE95BF
MSQVTGKVVFTINGKRLRSKEGAKLNMGGIARDPALSDSGVDGYTEKYEVPQVDCTINHTADISLQEIQNFKDGTGTFETDTGRIFTLKDAWCAKPPEMTKGEVTLVFQARECLEG